MPAAPLTVSDATDGSAQINYENADAGGNYFDWDQGILFIVKNGGGSSITVTVDSNIDCSQSFDHDRAIPVPAGEDHVIKCDEDRFADAANTRVNITYTAVASVTVAAIKMRDFT